MALKNISPYELGATLYMSILNPNALDYIAGTKVPKLRSLVLCLEDALLEKDVSEGMNILEKILIRIGQVRLDITETHFPLVFVRPRHLDMGKRIAQMAELHSVDGLIAPKIIAGDYAKWFEVVRHTDLYIMPTLETEEVFDQSAMKDLRDEFLSVSAERILVLRVGGNDLMSCLGLRRVSNTSLYEGPLLYVVSMLMSVMRPKGFELTAPVFENIDGHGADADLLREVTRDVSFGFVGKTIIHPSQVDIVQNAFKVASADYEAATKILALDAAAVFKFEGAMCEPATHSNWARRILSRAKVFGVVGGEAPLSVAGE